MCWFSFWCQEENVKLIWESFSTDLIRRFGNPKRDNEDKIEVK